VLTREVYDALKNEIPENLAIKVVDTSADPDAEYSLLDYRKENSLPTATFTGGAKLTLPKHGRHMATNALCIKAMLELTGFSPDDALTALIRFDGVWRRDDFAGRTVNGTQVFDDYAHNPEKILSCLQGMRERISGNIFAVFQPHGYKPFGFMEEQLFKYMNTFLTPQDRMILLEPFYAGGTSSFKPSSAEVVEKWRRATTVPERFSVFPDRKTLADFLKETPTADDLIVIMGARDNSLSDFAVELTHKEVQ
jgi:UDP-N-acetylmuramate--alanine ligase